MSGSCQKRARAGMQGKPRQVGRRSNGNKIRKRTYEPAPEPSTRCIVNVTQDVRLELQILQSMLDYIADADNTG